MTANSIKELRQIPGVGKTIAQNFLDIGVRSIQDLQGQNPEEIYQRLCMHQGQQIDRCMLYVCRCAVYYASTTNPDPELLKWWNWKNRELEL